MFQAFCVTLGAVLIGVGTESVKIGVGTFLIAFGVIVRMSGDVKQLADGIRERLPKKD